MRHEYFNDVDFGGIYRLPGPLALVVSDEGDAKYFGEIDMHMQQETIATADGSSTPTPTPSSSTFQSDFALVLSDQTASTSTSTSTSFGGADCKVGGDFPDFVSNLR
jgi:hypothetical protein